jgi:uncharacterized protein (DUF1697 family)
VPRHVAFLRAINIGGRRISSDDLRSAFEEIGFRNVDTFRASGNVIFDADRARPPTLTKRIEAGLEESLGFEVITFLRAAADACAIAAHEPFDPELVAASAGKLQVDLLLTAPSASARRQVLAMATEQDRLAINERELYWLPSGGTLESTLDLKAIGKLIGPSTRRTKGTMELIASKYLTN